MQGSFKFTKLKLVAGYVVILLLALFAIGFIYSQSMSLTGEDEEEGLTRRKLFLTSETLAKLYEAEGISLAFLQTEESRHFNAYIGLMEEIRGDIDTLRGLSRGAGQVARLDTIEGLLVQRVQKLRELIYARRDFMPEDFYRRAVEELEALRDTTEGANVVTRVVTTLDSTYVRQERPGFFRRLFSRDWQDSVLQVTESEHLEVDTVEGRGGMPSADSVIQMIREMQVEFEEAKERVAEQVYRQELALIQGGQGITERVKQLLGELEQEEVTHAMTRAAEQQRVARQITRTTGWIGTVACVLVIVFTSLVFSDISRSQRYRRELEEANRYAEQLLRNREQLMLTVTHDIKSPLSSIIGYIELLEGTELEGRQRYFLGNMKGSAEHILRLANDLLDFSRLEAGEMEVNRMRYNPRKLLEEVAESFLPLAGKKGLELKQDIGRGLDMSCEGDPLRIRQVVVNLVSNAVKYTREGRVTLSAYAAEGREPRLVVMVKDTGPGMTEEEQGMVFNEFTRLDDPQTAGTEGTGLGLTITLKLVKLMGGRISVESRKGEGSTFTVRLPLSPVGGGEEMEVEAGDKEDAGMQDGERGQLERGKLELRALLVDDDPLQLALCREVLSKEGVVCETCMEPRKVIGRLKEGVFDIVLTDIQMPEMDGFELVREIRASEDARVREVPVIALSARGDVSEDKYIEAGFSIYLAKPFSSKRLHDVVRKLTNNAEWEKERDSEKKQEEKSDIKWLEECDGKGYSLRMIQSFTDGDEEATREIVERFSKDCEENFERLTQCAREGDVETVSRLAHKMFPMFKQFAIDAVVPLLVELERMDIKQVKIEKVVQSVGIIVERGGTVVKQMSENVRGGVF